LTAIWKAFAKRQASASRSLKFRHILGRCAAHDLGPSSLGGIYFSLELAELAPIGAFPRFIALRAKLRKPISNLNKRIVIVVSHHGCSRAFCIPGSQGRDKMACKEKAARFPERACCCQDQVRREAPLHCALKADPPRGCPK
jgi:hypothetical protein